MEFLRRIREQLRQVWQGMSFARQTLLVAVVIASLALIGIVGYWAFQPDYRILYSGLSPDDEVARQVRRPRQIERHLQWRAALENPQA